MIRSFVPTLTALTLLAAVPAANAAERFASPDETRLTQDCLTPDTACALGKAVEASPPGAAIGDEVLTLLSGSYDDADLAAGRTTPAAEGGLLLPAGLTLQGDPAGPAPQLTVADPRRDVVAVDAPEGGVLRHLAISRTGANTLAVWMSGPGGLGARSAVVGEPTFPGDRARVASSLPYLAERIAVTAGPHTPAMQVDGEGVVLNSLVRQLGAGIGGAGLKVISSGGLAEVVGTTVVIDGEQTALSVTGVGSSARAVVKNTLAYGPIRDFSADAINGTASGDPGAALYVQVLNSAFRRERSDVHATATVVGFTDPGLGADLVPSPTSPLVDAGVDDARLGATDLAGRARRFGGAVDIGAFETQSPKVKTSAPGPILGSPVPDLARPTTKLRGLAGKIGLRKLRAGLRPTITTDEPARVRVSLSTLIRKGSGARRKTVTRVLGVATGSTTSGNPLTLRVVPKAGKVPAGVRKVTVTVTAIDGAGNRTIVEKLVTVR